MLMVGMMTMMEVDRLQSGLEGAHRSRLWQKSTRIGILTMPCMQEVHHHHHCPHHHRTPPHHHRHHYPLHIEAHQLDVTWVLSPEVDLTDQANHSEARSVKSARHDDSLPSMTKK